MALKKIRLLWGTPPIDGGQWRLRLFHVQRLNYQDQSPLTAKTPGYLDAYLHKVLAISIRGAAGWALVLLVIAYFSSAFFLLRRIQANDPHNRIAYVDLVSPMRWKRLSKLKGESMAAAAGERLEARAYAEALGLLRAGLARDPGNFETRLRLAQLYSTFRLFHLARRTTAEGCELGYPGRAYLEFAFGLAQDADKPEAWIALCQSARARYDELPPEARPAGDDRWLARQAIEALCAAERYHEALAAIPSAFNPEDVDGRLATLRCQLALQDLKGARETALRWTREAPQSPEAWQALARVQRDNGDLAGMDEALARLRACEGRSTRMLLFTLRQRYLAGQAEAARALIREYLFRHGAEPDAFTPLASTIAEVGPTEDLAILDEELGSLGYTRESVQWARLEIALKAHVWPEVLRQADLLQANGAQGLVGAQREWLETATLLARACDDAGTGLQSTLAANVADHPGTLRLYQRILDALLDAGRLETASHVLTLAESPYPDSQTIAAYRERITRLVAEAASSAPQSVQEKDPALASFASFSQAIDARIAAGDSAGALALIAAARRANPSWQTTSAARLEEWELPLRARSDDPLVLQLLLRTRLARDSDAPSGLRALATAIYSEGRKENAILILKEILRHTPDDAEALAQLTVWQPPAGKPETAPACPPPLVSAGK